MTSAMMKSALPLAPLILAVTLQLVMGRNADYVHRAEYEDSLQRVNRALLDDGALDISHEELAQMAKASGVNSPRRRLLTSEDDPCVNDQAALNQAALALGRRPKFCPSLHAAGSCDGGDDYGTGFDASIQEHCKVICGLCEAEAAPTCSFATRTQRKEHLANLLNRLGACTGCAAPSDEALETKKFLTAPDPNVTTWSTTTYATDDEKDPCRFPGVSCDRCGAAISIYIGWGTTTHYWPGHVSDSLFELTKLQVFHCQKPPYQHPAGPYEDPANFQLSASGYERLTDICVFIVFGSLNGDFPSLKTWQNGYFLAFMHNSFSTGNFEDMFGGTPWVGLWSFNQRLFPAPIPGGFTPALCQSLILSLFVAEMHPSGVMESRELPACFATLLRRAARIDLTDTRLIGSPAVLFNSKTISSLVMHGNLFEGDLPEDLASNFIDDNGLSRLELFDFTGSKLTGKIPSLTGLSSLRLLKLSGNHFNDASAVDGNGLRIDVSGNQFKRFPEAWHALPNTREIDLSNNPLESFPPAGVFDRAVAGEDSVAQCGATIKPKGDPFDWPNLENFLMNDMPNLTADARDVLMALAWAPMLRKLEIKNARLANDLPMEVKVMTPRLQITNCLAYTAEEGFPMITSIDLQGNKITGVTGIPYMSLQTANFRHNLIEAIHTDWLGVRQVSNLDLRNNPLRMDVRDPSAVCPGAGEDGTTGVLAADLGSFTVNPDDPSHLCGNPCKITYIVQTDPDIDAESLCRCSAGYSGTGKTCTMCPLDSWSQSGMTSCVACPDKSTTQSTGTTSIQGCDCDVGFYVEFAGNMDQQACVACPANRFNKFKGATSIANCLRCPNGQYSPEGASECLKCPQSSTGAGVGAGCSCDIGFYVDPNDASQCLQCAGESRTTAQTGSTDVSDCICDKDFMEYPLADDWQARLNRGEPLGATECRACEKGTVCEKGSSFVSLFYRGSDASGAQQVPLIEPRYWASAEEPLKIYVCRDTLVCPGGAAETCGKGLLGRACEICAVGMVWDGDKCAECSAVEKLPILFPLVPFLLMVFISFVLYQGSCVQVASWDSLRSAFVVALFIQLNHYQAISLITAVGIELPAGSRQADTYDMWKWTLDALPLFRPGCSNRLTFSSKYIAKMCTPLFLMLTLFGMWALSNLVTRFARPGLKKRLVKVNLPMEIRKTISVFMSIIFGFFSGVVAMSLLLLVCAKNPAPNTETSLAASLDITCFDSEEWQEMLGMCIFGITVYCLGCGAIFAYVIRVAPYEFPRSKDFQDTWKFLFSKYNPETWWWGLAHITKVSLYNLCLAVFSVPTNQLASMMVVTIIFSNAVIHYVPYRRPVLVLFENITSLSIIFACGCVLYFAKKEDTRADGTIEIIATIGVLTPAIILPFVGVFMLYFKVRPSWRKEQQMDFNHMIRVCRDITALMEDPETDEEKVFSRYLGVHEWGKYTIARAMNAMQPGILLEFPRSRQLTSQTFVDRMARISPNGTKNEENPAKYEIYDVPTSVPPSLKAVAPDDVEVQWKMASPPTEELAKVCDVDSEGTFGL